LRNDRLKRWLVGELMQAFASALMIICLVAFALFLTNTFYTVAGFHLPCTSYSKGTGWGDSSITLPGDITSPLDYFRCKLTLLDMRLANLYDDVVTMNLHTERAEWDCWIFFGTEIQCGWDLHPLVQSLHALAYKLIQYRIGVNAMLVLANYVEYWFLPLFLPIGIILRAIPFTRGAGGLIIALVIGFYFIFPMVYMLGDLLLSGQLNRPDMSFIDPNANKCVYSDLAGAMSLYATDAGIAQQAALSVSTIRSLLTALAVETVLPSLMALAATVIFIRAFSPIFGSESFAVIYGISKLI